ncbi:glycerol-3-phosphate dehydrogenase/oxidase [Chitinimonas sp. JJ19]|uniref:glycerol-3-phosphate dehydrogenase/oxidase n=1 Tax=Chitinimonas sp. JJ19 TaxID=3109352 RepID=UPI003002A290
MERLSRQDKLSRLGITDWDLLVIGGGISGAGVLREAARLGWKVLLIEQRDFAWGTSSRSSKLVHGGLRYLKEGQFRTTLHSVHERQRLMREAPELIEPQSFLFADCKGRQPGRWLFQLGLAIYDHMAGENSHAYCSSQAVAQLAPGLAPDKLRGGMVYRDAKTDDARLVWRVLEEAEHDGGIAINYLAARTPIIAHGQLAGMVLEDLETGKQIAVQARTVINATGAWADRLRASLGRKPMLRPLRGSHLVIPFWRLPVAQAVSLMHPRDGRPVFFYPWEGATLIGTTDLDHAGDLDTEASITDAEVDYLLAAVNDQFPAVQLGRADVSACYAGVRPVVDEGGSSPSSAGRDHVVLDEQGLITLTGGKLTTFRLMAQDALALAAKRMGRPYQPSTAPVFSAASSLPPQLAGAMAQRLRARYGPHAAEVADAATADTLAFVPGTHTLWQELQRAARAESVVHLDDLLLRRTRLGILLPRGGLDHQARIRALCQPELGWTDAHWEAELLRYQQLIARHYSLPPTRTESAP